MTAAVAGFRGPSADEGLRALASKATRQKE